MSTLAQYIAENYRSTMDLTWHYPHVGYARAKFKPDKRALGLEVAVSFELREEGGLWHVSFEVFGLRAGDGVQYAFDTFNGVVQAVEEFLEVREPGVLVIASKQEPLARIYETYLRREADLLQRLGYRMEEPERIEPFAQFTLRRVKPSDWKSA
jgi:hypothetical protein